MMRLRSSDSRGGFDRRWRPATGTAAGSLRGARELVLALAILSAGAASAQTQLDKLRDRAVRVYLGDLDSRDAARRREAARELGAFERPEVVTALAEALADADEGVREAAASSLWRLSEIASPAEPELRQALNDRSPGVQVRAAGALEAMGTAPEMLVEARRAALEGGDWFEVALAARDLVGRVDSETLVGPLLSALRRTPVSSDRDRFDAGDVLAPLVDTGDRDLIPPLTAALAEPGLPKVDLVAALARFDPEPDGWKEALLAASRDPDPAVRVATAEALETRAQIEDGWPDEVLHLLRDVDRDVRWAAIDALAAAGAAAHAAAPELVRLLAAGDEGVRRNAVRALGRIGDRSQPYDPAALGAVGRVAARPLLQIAEVPGDPDLRRNAMEGYAGLALAPGEAVPALMRTARSSDLEHLRVISVRALGLWGRQAKEALPLLDELAPDSASLLGSAAGQSAARIRAALAMGSATAPAAVPVQAPPAGVLAVRGADRETALAYLRQHGHEMTEDGLYRAINASDADAVEAYLDAGVAAGDAGSTGIPPLHHALMSGCRYGATETDAAIRRLVATLLDHGADPNALDGNGNPALFRASYCDTQVHRLLIAAGADVNARNATGSSAFVVALVTNPAAAEALLDAGFRLTPEEAAMYEDWLLDDPARRALLVRAGAR